MWKEAFCLLSVQDDEMVTGKKNMFAQSQFCIFLLADQCPPEDEEVL